MGRRCTPWLGVVWAQHMALNAAQAHMSLTRAAYVQANEVLLDDPLSAVDTHVGRDILLPLDTFRSTSVL